MFKSHRVYGIVTVCTVLACIVLTLALTLFADNPEIGRVGARREAIEAAQVRGVMWGSLAGFAVGLALDFAFNGLPRRAEWRFTRRNAILVASAAVSLVAGIISLWTLTHLPRTNY